MVRKLKELKYDELFEDISVAEKYAPDYYTKTYPKLMKKAVRPWKVIARSVVSNLKDRLNDLDKRDTVCIYPLERFFNLGDIICDDYNLFTFGDVFSNLITKRYDNVKVLSNNAIQRNIFKSFETHDMHYAYEAMSRLEQILKSNKIKIIILGNDWTFFERLCAYAGREAEIPIVCLQHGIYHKNMIDIMEFGKYSTQFWCWSEYVKKYYEELYGIKEGFLRVVGYPHKVPSDCGFKNKNRVLFVSTPYSIDDRSVLEDYEKVVESVMDVCRLNNLEFSFRPHPREKINYYRDRFSNYNNFRISMESNVQKDILDSGIVIGDISSMLLEANILNRRVIQLIWNDNVKKLSQSELYDSFVKISNNTNELTDAILNNIGKDYNDKKIFYATGDPRIFKRNIIINIYSIINSNGTYRG